jgi:hypothetical protein
MRTLSAIFIALVTVLTVRSANAQPFFGGGVVAFNPEISTVSSGVVLDVQPTVSQDLKYVTINTQVEDSRVIALHNFQVESGLGQQGPAQGFVGALGSSTSSTSTASNSPEDIERRAVAARSILSRQGMFLLRVN